MDNMYVCSLASRHLRMYSNTTSHLRPMAERQRPRIPLSPCTLTRIIPRLHVLEHGPYIFLAASEYVDEPVNYPQFGTTSRHT